MGTSQILFLTQRRTRMINTNKSHQSQIQELEKLAAEVLSLKKQLRQRRPIVIEFCGSPKAGKTSCINSLNIFLKRNGFKTAILSEHASFSPISDKHNPVFNVWTCTSAINEINEKMDQAQHGEEIDVIISDRGIFDALCWFKWLKSQSHMNKKEYKTLTDFATLYRWQKNIDLVYIFMVSPDESIKREYANLLTNKRGSIMREDVLEQYLASVKETMQEYKEDFRAIYEIDTTSKQQNDVGYEVTSKTLEVLRNMLIEKIGYLKASTLSLLDGFNNFKKLEPQLNGYNFNNRDVVEADETLIQPIPIAVVITPQKNKILCIKKTINSTPKSSPESGKLLFYAGGHTRMEDETLETKGNFLETSKNTLERELFEELGISISLEDKNPDFCLYTPQYSEKSKQHLAIGWIIPMPEETKFNLDAYEIIQKKGKTKSGCFLTFQEIEKLFKEEGNLYFESWSKEILLKYFKENFTDYFIDNIDKMSEHQQLTLFDS